MEDMTKDELIAMFHKVRVQTVQIAKEKKQAVESLEAVTKEKEDIRSKALVIIQRCKDLEEKQATNGMYKTKCESYAIIFEEQTNKIADYERRLAENAIALKRLEDMVSTSSEVIFVDCIFCFLSVPYSYFDLFLFFRRMPQQLVRTAFMR